MTKAGAAGKRRRPGRARRKAPGRRSLRDLLQPRRWRAALRRGLAAFRLLAIGTAVFVAASCSILDFELPQPEDFPIHGIDISYYQERVNWPVVRRGGTAFAWIKATEGGDWLDPRFRENWALAGRHGVPRGAYHFWYFCRPAAEQAAWFLKHVPKDADALPPVLDMEWTASKSCRVRPSRGEVHAEMRTWLTMVEAALGKRPVIYTTVDFYADRIDGAFEDYHLWIRSVAGHPSLRYGERKWHFWQHTATGRVPGVRGDVDRNVFYGTQSDWRRFVAGELAPNG